MIDIIYKFDLAILFFIRDNLFCPFFDIFMPIITRLGDSGIVPIILALILALIPKTRKTGLSVGVAIILGFLVGNIFLKNAVGRIRPYEYLGLTDLLVGHLSDFSFPSGHTLVCFETATVIFIRERKIFGIPALILASLVAFSRLYLFVHFPTDVIAGVILGCLFGYIGVKITDRILPDKNSK